MPHGLPWGNSLLFIGRLPRNPPGLSTNCVTESTIQCQNAVLSSTTGNISITFEQLTNSNWTMVYFVFKTTNGVAGLQPNNSSFQSPNATYINSLNPRKIVTVTIPGIPPNSVAGTPLTGTIWAKYTIQNTTAPQYKWIAVVNFKAT